MKKLKEMNAKILVLFFFICSSCSAQKGRINDDSLVYSLIKHHYEIPIGNVKNRFLYYKTIDITEDANFNWVDKYSLSYYLNNNFVKMNCGILDNIFSPNQVEIINDKFSNLSSMILDENKFLPNILNKNILDKETYINVPNAANRKISYPLIIHQKEEVYALFVEDAHNEGGRFYIYKLQNGLWELVCKDTLWLV